MARLPYVDPDKASPAVKKIFAKLPMHLNIFRMVANSETTFRPFLGLGTALLSSETFDPKLRELVILHVGKISNGNYEWTQHVPIAQAVGASDEQIKAIEAGDVEAGCFDPVERACLAFTTEVAASCRASDATFAAAREHLSPAQIVELITIIGFYRMVAMLTEATEVDIDAAAGTKIVDALRRTDLSH